MVRAYRGPEEQVLLRMSVLRNVGMGRRQSPASGEAPDLGTIFSQTQGQDIHDPAKKFCVSSSYEKQSEKRCGHQNSGI